MQVFEYQYRGKPQTIIIDEKSFQKKDNFGYGLYRDIIYDLEKDEYIIFVSKNEIIKWFPKLIQILQQQSNFQLLSMTLEEYQNLFDLFYVNENNNTGVLRVNVEYFNLFKYLIQNKLYKQIHSWDIGSGDSNWDQHEVQEYDEMGYLITDWRNLYISVQQQPFEERNQLQVRYSDDNDTIKLQARFPVFVTFQVPWEYLGDSPSNPSSPKEILDGLRNGQLLLENVITWKAFSGKDHFIEQEENNYVFPEFVMVGTVIDENSQIGFWREFQIQGGCQFNGTDLIQNTELFDLYQQNGFRVDYLQQLEQQDQPNFGTDVQVTPVNENKVLVYPHGVYLDYKIHSVFYKTQTMRIRREIIFGFTQFLEQ